jgi:hypothetical protein
MGVDGPAKRARAVRDKLYRERHSRQDVRRSLEQVEGAAPRHSPPVEKLSPDSTLTFSVRNYPHHGGPRRLGENPPAID